MDVDNQYTSDVLKTLYNDKKYTDFEIRAGNKRVLCHRAVISAKSQYFDSICASGLCEAVLDYADDEHGYMLEAMVKFMYLGETAITEYNVEPLLLAADFIKHADLIYYCEKFMIKNLCLVNFTNYMKLANKVSLQSLKDASDCMAKEKCSEVLLTDWFLCLSVEEVCEYLSDDELDVTSEDEVLVAVQRWLHSTKASPSVKESYVQSIFPCVRLRFCSKSALESVSRDESSPMLMKFKILEYLHHGLHGEDSARKSYASAHGLTTALTKCTSTSTSVAVVSSSPPRGASASTGTSATVLPSPSTGASASASTSATSKFSMAAPIKPKSSAQEHVLIVGGLTANDEIHKNIVFLDKAGEDAILTEAPLCVHSCTCAVCTTGNGLIFSGGYDRAIKRTISKVQIFSLSNRSWRNLPDMLQPVDTHGVAYLDEHFYTFGGSYTENGKEKHLYSDVNVLDLQSQSWSHCQPLPCTTKESGVAVVGKDILVIGGWPENGCWLSQTYKYNTKTGKRTRCQDMPKPGNVSQSTVAVDNLIYVLAYQMFLQYDVRADQWSELPLPLQKERKDLHAMVHTQGCLCVLGGYIEDRNHPTDRVLRYNFSSKKWTLEKRRMPVAVRQAWAFTVVI